MASVIRPFCMPNALPHNGLGGAMKPWQKEIERNTFKHLKHFLIQIIKLNIQKSKAFYDKLIEQR